MDGRGASSNRTAGLVLSVLCTPRDCGAAQLPIGNRVPALLVSKRGNHGEGHHNTGRVLRTL